MPNTDDEGTMIATRAACALLLSTLMIETAASWAQNSDRDDPTPRSEHHGAPSDRTRPFDEHDTSGNVKRPDSKRGSGANDGTPLDPRFPQGSVDAHDSEIHPDPDDRP